MHDEVARKFAARLCLMLRTAVEVKLCSIDHLSYSEFIFSTDNPTCLNLVQVKSTDERGYANSSAGNFIVDVNPSILFSMIDRMLGDEREKAVMARRPLTRIELKLASRIIDTFLDELQVAWEKIGKLNFCTVQTESNPQIIQEYASSEVCLLSMFEIMMPEARGLMSLCVPLSARLLDTVE
jgi:flagellar motor switch protein FliM